MSATLPADGEPAQWPPVSVVMPVLNEERHLAHAVGRILAQDYQGDLELVMALGPSRDGTDAIAAALEADPRVRSVLNPDGRTPQALNAAIAAAKHDILVRVDGHGLLPDGYIATAVRTLEATGADNVGGMMVPEGTTPFENAVAAAMSSRLGIGGARFHIGGAAGPAESVYLGVFRRAALERVGGFDEAFSRAQDWELNHRLRASGGVVWFTPDLRVAYRPRPGLRPLAAQFYQTGQWRRQVMRIHPGTASTRFLAPPAAVLAMAVGTALGAVGLATGSRWLLAGWLVPLGYAAAVLLGSLAVFRGLSPRARAWLPLVVMVMHVCWGVGFLRGPGRRR